MKYKLMALILLLMASVASAQITYVDSAASGADDGTSWTDAYDTLIEAIGVPANEIIYIDDGHSEDPGGAVDYDFANGTTTQPIKLICVDKGDSEALSSGASIAQGTTGRKITIDGNVIIEGVNFTTTDDLAIGKTTGFQLFRNCTLDATTQAASNSFANIKNGIVRLESCTVDLSDDASRTLGTAGSNSARLELRDCTIACGAGNTDALVLGTRGVMVLEGCTFTGTTTDVITVPASDASYHSSVVMMGCTLPTFTNLVSGTPGVFTTVRVEQCESGTHTTTPETLTAYHEKRGIITSDTSRYRDDGASDGEQSYCWELVSNANTLEGHIALATLPVAAWVDGGSEITVTVFFAGGDTLQDNEIWAELCGPSNAASAVTKYYTESLRMATQGTAANVTTDASSTWNGSGVGTKQKLTFTAFTPTLPGPLYVRVYLSKASTTVYVDPRLDIQ